MKSSIITYNPSLTVKENAQKNGVSEAAVRYYIKVNGIDRRFDRKQNVIEDCRDYLKNHPNATWDELQRNTGHSLSTMRKYRGEILAEKPQDVVNLPIYGVIVVAGKPFEIASLRDIEMVLASCNKKSKMMLNGSGQGVVYFGRDDKHTAVKIGSTSVRRVKRRQNELSTTFPGYRYEKLILCDDRKSADILEKTLHQKFSEYKIGCEWFNIPFNDLNSVYQEMGAIDPLDIL